MFKDSDSSPVSLLSAMRMMLQRKWRRVMVTIEVRLPTWL